MYRQFHPLSISLFIAAHLLIPQARAQTSDSFSGSMQQMLAATQQSYLHSHDLPRALDALRALYSQRRFAPI